jgi:orotate phosphoribosyltransferase
LEDVVTTGGSSQKAIDRLREAGFKPVATLTVVDRQQGGEELLTKQGLKFLRLATLEDVRGA